MNIKQEYNKILCWLETYKQETNCRGVVLGISGGKDSTVVAMLAKKVFGDNVLGLLMPNGTQADLQDSIDICNSLNLEYRIVNLETAFNNLTQHIETKLDYVKTKLGRSRLDYVENCPKITVEARINIAPRLRMTTLYAVAQTMGYRVIGTGNASEKYIGWTTKWGDSAYDFNPIAHLTCTEVIELGLILAEEFNLDRKFIIKTPNDGLCGKTDEEKFGFSYKELDNYLKSNTLSTTETFNKIMSMHKKSEHKRCMPATLERF